MFTFLSCAWLYFAHFEPYLFVSLTVSDWKLLCGSMLCVYHYKINFDLVWQHRETMLYIYLPKWFPRVVWCTIFIAWFILWKLIVYFQVVWFTPDITFYYLRCICSLVLACFFFFEGPLMFHIWILLTFFTLLAGCVELISGQEKKRDLMFDIHESICTTTTT